MGDWIEDLALRRADSNVARSDRNADLVDANSRDIWKALVQQINKQWDVLEKRIGQPGGVIASEGVDTLLLRRLDFPRYELRLDFSITGRFIKSVLEATKTVFSEPEQLDTRRVGFAVHREEVVLMLDDRMQTVAEVSGEILSPFAEKIYGVVPR